jgi:hypothetical protein
LLKLYKWPCLILCNMTKQQQESKANIKSIKCIKCNNQIKNKGKNDFCNTCFQDVVFKRIRKFVRANKYLDNTQELLVIDALTQKILKNIVNKPVLINYDNSNYGKLVKQGKKLTISNKKLLAKVKNKQKILLPVCLDDLELLYLEYFFQGKSEKFKLMLDQKLIPLYFVLTKEECLRLAKLYKTKFNFKSTTTSKFLDSLESEFEGTKHKLRKYIYSK